MAKEIKFIKAVYDLKELPGRKLPEIVLCGRSNVGKSSFINSLFNRKNMAKTSSAPGKTRSINYYQVGEEYYIVDLPGYGYAKTSKEERKKWGKLINEYFSLGRHFFLIIHIIDSRHTPTELDIFLNTFLKQKGFRYYFVMNKADKLKQSEMLVKTKELSGVFPEAVNGENLFLYSSVNSRGKKQLVSSLNKLTENSTPVL